MAWWARVLRTVLRVGLAAFIAAVATRAVPASGAAIGTTTRVSVSTAGVQADAESFPTSISADGRYVLFQSFATNLIPGDLSGGGIFLRDVVGRTTRKVADGGFSSMSPDGRYITYVSGPEYSLYLRNLSTGATQLVSVAMNGGKANHETFESAISANDRYVVFASGASNLVPDDTGGGVYVRDLVRATTERVDVTPAGAPGNGYSVFPSISADGRYMAFESEASNLVPDDTNAVDALHDIFVRDRVAGTTRRVNVSSAGVQANGESEHAEISGDGRYVSFWSEASNLVARDTNFRRDVFVRDLVAGTTERVSVSSDEVQGNRDSFSEVSISPDGRYVAFDSYAGNLVPGDYASPWSNVYLRDRVAGTTEKVSVATVAGGGGDTPGSYSPFISANGRYVAFGSLSSAIVANDTNDAGDAFVRDRLGVPPTVVCNGQAATIVGTSGADTMTGTSGPDVIVGLGGNDTIYGRGGDDLICAGAGADVISAGAGDDRVQTGPGHDRAFGGDGHDQLFGSAGDDAVSGGAGNDALWGGLGDDTLIGGLGTDACHGGSGTDTETGCETIIGVP
jgi:Ca2+-binding RTX toxin-like protein